MQAPNICKVLLLNPLTYFAMSSILNRCAALSLLGLAALSAAHAAAPAKPAIAYTDPKEAGPDFLVQGEYAGKDGAQKLGAQVIALGDGQFQCVFLPGGLPGDGWDGKTRVRVDGKTDGSLTSFERADTMWNAHIHDGKLEGQDDHGGKFTLKRVERASPTLGLAAPAGAKVLFDGKNADAWAGGKLTPDGLLMAGCKTSETFQSFKAHVEFRLPFKPLARGQSRGNSGFYMQDRYEIQILDSFGLDGKNNECGSVYTQVSPKVNMCFPPLTWQTYEIEFQAAQFDATGNKTKNAEVTVYHNGILVQDHTPIVKPTGHGAPEAPTPGPIQLQGHGNPVVFRNVWVVPKN